MYATQPHLKCPRDSLRNSLHQPYELAPPEQQIHHCPDNIRKSIRLHRNRVRPSLSHKIKPKDNKNLEDLSRNIDEQLNANISICKVFKQQHKNIPQDYADTVLPATRLQEEFQTTADRMMSLRKRLSPVKRYKVEGRLACSVDSVREAPVQRSTFLNIEKLQLIKIYSQVEKKVETPRGESLEERYQIMPIISKPLQKAIDQNQLKSMVISLRKTLKEGHMMKFHPIKPKTKTFAPPFQRYYYKDFIWKIAFSNGLLLNNTPEEIKLKVYIGKGNNSQLVRSLIKRRSWWTFTQKWQDAQLVWTQLKINPYFNLQSPAQDRPRNNHPSLPSHLAQQNQPHLKIMNEHDLQLWENYWHDHRSIQQKLTEDMARRNFAFKKHPLVQLNPKTLRIQNHMSQNFVIGNKKALLYTMRQYYQSQSKQVFDHLPLSFHLAHGHEDPQYNLFLQHYYQRKKTAKLNNTHNIWIVKPGQLTNRGNGIIVCLTLDQIKAILKRGGRHRDGTHKTYILQQYIERPFLYQKRKFDIRHYLLVTSANGRFKGYWFQRGYIRTSSAQYTLTHGQASVHLTNDAVQKNLPDYGRYEKGNKVSYEDFQLYLDRQYPSTYNFFTGIYPVMKQIATDVVRASARTLDPRNLQHNFQLFGLDFMIDGKFRPWLIEVNSNPCLELSCPLLSSIIPDLIENTLKICVDSLAGPPADFTQKRARFNEHTLATNQFELVYDSVVDEHELKGAGTLCSTLNAAELDREEDEQFEDDGEALED